MISVYTEGEKCKKCYSCVRSCPVKAIEVHGGQAHIIEELCISCGHCIEMCSQKAKKIRSSIPEVLKLLENNSENAYAIVAPSFPAAFLDIPPGKLVTSMRAAGFRGVYEVAFGADLVSYEYYRRYKDIILRKDDDKPSFIISSPCPAVVFYIEKSFPELLPFLADVASPMEAMARVIREKIDPEGKIVFIGPCVAKKDEAKRSRAVHHVLTYAELREIFQIKDTNPENISEQEFDPPHANLGRIYPVTGGLLKAACIDMDILESPVTVVEGPERVVEILQVLSRRIKNKLKINYKFYDLLFCEGCIGGPVMTNDLTFYERKRYIVEYMKERPLIVNIKKWAEVNREYIDIDLKQSYQPRSKHLHYPSEIEIKKILAMTGKNKPEDELNCGACGYSSCREKAIAVFRGMAEVEMCLPYLINKIEKTVEDLRLNQARLIQAEKLASMGQMAAGIAHELNNPLGVLLMYAHLLKDEINPENPLYRDVNRIIQEAERTRKIVQGILNFARRDKVERHPCNINNLVIESLDGVLKSFSKTEYRVNLELDPELKEELVDSNQLRQVFDNIIKNACEAMPGGGTISITTKQEENCFSVTISDTGPGISQENMDKLFSPFFTTKPVGKGTGLGLPVCYGIIKMHGGNIEAGNNPDGGAFFKIIVNHYIQEKEGVRNGKS